MDEAKTSRFAGRKTKTKVKTTGCICGVYIGFWSQPWLLVPVLVWVTYGQRVWVSYKSVWISMSQYESVWVISQVNSGESTRRESMRMSQIIWESNEMDTLSQFTSCNSKEKERKENNESGSWHMPSLLLLCKQLLQNCAFTTPSDMISWDSVVLE